MARYLVFLGPEKYATYNRIRYLRIGITYIFLTKSWFKVDSYNSLCIEKILTLHNIKIRIKSALTKDKNHYCYKYF